MRLINATIFGFGKWVDYTIDFSSDSGLCIYGENESGKSTIRNFILFMLFGLPPKQRAFYRPKTSGRMGGRLTISDSEALEYTIERFDEVKNGAAVCYTENGEVFDEVWLKERLNGMTLQTYESIFSFSQVDLNRIKEMKEEELGEVLLAIGLSGSTKIYSLEKQLEQRIGDLFKPFGKKPAINQQIEDIDKLFTSLKQFKANEATYQEKKNDEANGLREIQALQATLETENIKRKDLEKLMQMLPVLNDYRYYTSRIETYSGNIEFPESGINRLENINQTLLPLKSQLSVLKDNEEKYKRKIDSLRDEAIPNEIYEEAKEHLSLKRQFEADNKERQIAEDGLAKMRLELETELNRLNVGLDLVTLESISFPFHIEKTWNELKNNNEQLMAEAGNLYQEEKLLKQERNYLLNQIQETEDDILSDERLQQLNDKITEHKEFYLLEKVKRQSNQKLQSWKKDKAKKVKNINNTFFLCIVLAILAGVGTFLTNQSWLIQVSLLFLIIGISRWFLGKQSINEMDKLLHTDNTTYDSEQISDEERNEAEHLIALHNKNESERKHLTEQVRTNDVKRLNLLEKKKTHNEKEQQLDAQVNVQYEQYPFLRKVEMSYWPEFFHAMKQVLRLANSLKQSIKELEHVQTRKEACKLQISSFFKRNNWDVSPHIEQQFERIAEFIGHADEVNRQLEHYQELVKENCSEQEELMQKIRVVEETKEDLYKIAHVDTEEAFYQKANNLSEKLELLQAREKLVAQLETVYPQGAWKKYTDEQIDEQAIEQHVEKTIEKIKSLEEKIESNRKQLAMVSAELLGMESSDDYSRTMHQFEMEVEQLNKLAKEWAVLKTAKEILVETKRNYRESHLANVIDKTSDYFCQLTGEKYRRIFAPNDKKIFQVEAANGIRYAVNELSQGTIDQLYVSLRLAISETMSENNRLPFIIDDAFVHFDSIRTKRIIDIVREIAKKQQVIIFTCKKEVLETFEDIKLLRLENPIRII